MSFNPTGIERNVGDTERMLSALGGALLVYLGLRRSPLALFLTALGGVLLFRGISGQSTIYDTLGLTTRGERAALRPLSEEAERLVDTAVEDSFPASDPPGWHSGSSFTQVDE